MVWTEAEIRTYMDEQVLPALEARGRMEEDEFLLESERRDARWNLWRVCRDLRAQMPPCGSVIVDQQYGDLASQKRIMECNASIQEIIDLDTERSVPPSHVALLHAELQLLPLMAPESTWEDTPKSCNQDFINSSEELVVHLMKTAEAFEMHSPEADHLYKQLRGMYVEMIPHIRTSLQQQYSKSLNELVLLIIDHWKTIASRDAHALLREFAKELLDLPLMNESHKHDPGAIQNRIERYMKGM